MRASRSSRHPITSWRSSPYFAGRSPLLTLLARPTQPLCSTIILNPSLSSTPLCPLSFTSFIPPVFLTTSAPRQPPPPTIRFLSSLAHLATHSLSLSFSPLFDPLSTLLHSRSRASRLPRTVHLLLLPASRLVPPGGDENFQTPRDRNRIVISRGSRPASYPPSLLRLAQTLSFSLALGITYAQSPDSRPRLPLSFSTFVLSILRPRLRRTSRLLLHAARLQRTRIVVASRIILLGLIRIVNNRSGNFSTSSNRRNSILRAFVLVFRYFRVLFEGICFGTEEKEERCDSGGPVSRVREKRLTCPRQELQRASYGSTISIRLFRSWEEGARTLLFTFEKKILHRKPILSVTRPAGFAFTATHGDGVLPALLIRPLTEGCKSPPPPRVTIQRASLPRTQIQLRWLLLEFSFLQRGKTRFSNGFPMDSIISEMSRCELFPEKRTPC